KQSTPPTPAGMPCGGRRDDHCAAPSDRGASGGACRSSPNGASHLRNAATLLQRSTRAVACIAFLQLLHPSFGLEAAGSHGGQCRDGDVSGGAIAYDGHSSTGLK